MGQRGGTARGKTSPKTGTAGEMAAGSVGLAGGGEMIGARQGLAVAGRTGMPVYDLWGSAVV